MMINFAKVSQGMRLRLLDFGTAASVYRQRLLSMGITPGVEILILRTAPLGCPVQIRVRGTSLALRKDEASLLNWEQLQ